MQEGRTDPISNARRGKPRRTGGIVIARPVTIPYYTPMRSVRRRLGWDESSWKEPNRQQLTLNIHMYRTRGWESWPVSCQVIHLPGNTTYHPHLQFHNDRMPVYSITIIGFLGIVVVFRPRSIRFRFRTDGVVPKTPLLGLSESSSRSETGAPLDKKKKRSQFQHSVMEFWGRKDADN